MKNNNNIDISGSITILEKIKNKTPWVFGELIRKPKINFSSTKMFKKISNKFSNIFDIMKFFQYFIFLVIVGVLQTGVIYIVMNKVPAISSDVNSNPIFVYPSINQALILESIIGSILILLVGLGFIILYKSTMYVNEIRIAKRYMIIGITLILIGFISLQSMLNIKIGG